MANKKFILIIVAGVILLGAVATGVFLWINQINASGSPLPDLLAQKMAPTDPCGCIPGTATDMDIPLGLAKSKQVIDDYLQKLNNSNLVLKEIIVFNNNSYARIAEKDSGINAMELFIDTETSIVISEYGSSMDWNLKYASIPDSRSLANPPLNPAGPMGGKTDNPLTISPDQAWTIAVQYLKQYNIKAQISGNVETFYGYYVIEYLHNGKVIGMISINGKTGEAFRHDWHDQFVERMNY
jgi:hypothetical protein